MKPLTRTLDRWFGRGDYSVTVPPMDGAFRPNDRLDAAPLALALPAPDALAATSRGLIVSSGARLVDVRKPDERVLEFETEITALTGLPDGGLAAALAGGRIVFADGRALAAHPDIRCITALAPAADGALYVANGSAAFAPADWSRDLMAARPTGSVWRLDPATGRATQLAGGLAYPCGLIEDGGGVVVSEAWRSAMTRISAAARRPEILLDNLPAYPGRLSRAPDGGLWLALFAPRSQLVEFVLKERGFRERMMREIEPDAWVAPTLRAGRSPLEPIQQGGVRQLGVLKPWSPSRSYGLIARLDEGFRPVSSFHSRANGRRHGVTSCLAHEGRLYFAAKGDGAVASFELGATP